MADMRLAYLAALLVLAGGSSAAGQRVSDGARPDALRIPFERYRLANGLTVILSPNPTIPMVTVDVWYHVGSKNELPGRTGFAHLFEHVMFTGSANAPYPLHDRLTEGVSGIGSNGSTSQDRTNYFETVPSNYLESTLWLEADRMGFLLQTLDSAKFVAQRDIVQNERRQNVDNQPYGRAGEIINIALYPDTQSVPLAGVRLHDGSPELGRGGRKALLSSVLRAGQRDARDRRRLRRGTGQELGREVLR